MTQKVAGKIAALGIIAACPQPVWAHELLMRYTLPVPFDLYLYAAAATLVVTFILLGWFVGASATQSQPAAANMATGLSVGGLPGVPAAMSASLPVDWNPESMAGPGTASSIRRLPDWVVVLLRVLILACLGLTVLAGLIGTRDPDDNVNLTLFWDIFLLGLTYATALIGNVYEFANPWQTLVDLGRWGRPGPAQARFIYPRRLAYWPALIFYIALIWLELFTLPGPRALSLILITYSLITFIGVWLFGQAAWFQYGELFGVFLRIVGLLAPLSYRQRPDGKTFEIHLRRPLSGLLQERPESLSLVVFVLFMLAGTTYDGMHQTLFWKGIFWNHLVPEFWPPGTGGLASEVRIERLYQNYQHIGLVLAPFFYLGIYLGILRLAQIVTKTSIPLHSLAFAFAYTILPIAFVYNLAHYYTLILVRFPVLPYLFSDPFGYGWNPLDLPHQGDPPILNMAAVWHVEVGLILAGHILSVWLAHKVALKLFPSRREAIVSQLPMLLLMMAYTIIGLWVIALPFALTWR